MNTVAVVRRNSIFSFLAFGLRLVANAVLFIGIARFYGATAFGQFSLAHVYFSLMLYVADFGYDFYLATEIGRDVRFTEDLVRKVMPMKILFSSLAVFLMVVFALLAQPAGETRSLMIVLAIGIPANTLMTHAAAIFRGNQDVLPEARIAFSQNALLLVFLVIIAILGLPLLAVAGVFVLSKVYGFVNLWRIARKRFPSLRWTFFPKDAQEVRALMGVGVNFGFNLLFGALYFQLDTILLDHLKGQESVGLYQAVMKLTALVLVLNEVAIAAVIPVLAQAFGIEAGRWAKIGKVVFKSLHLIGGFFGLLFFLCAKDILAFVYSKREFLQAADVMRIFGVILLVRFGMETYAMMLTTANKQRHRMVVVIFATLVNLLANLLAIPRFGIIGAAWVSLGTNMLIALIYFGLVSIHMGKWFPLIDLGQVLIFVGFILTAGIFLHCGITSLTIVLPFAIALTAVLTYVGFSKQEHELVSMFLRLRTS
ncbi:MAG TPA: oligosaccharide flippase family protein [Bacteroidota bacterium]|nr:oligosaccharide flippase family protein [Bacteroidota bacterium]